MEIEAVAVRPPPFEVLMENNKFDPPLLPVAVDRVNAGGRNWFIADVDAPTLFAPEYEGACRTRLFVAIIEASASLMNESSMS